MLLKRKCLKCGRINTHRLLNGVLMCGNEPETDNNWEDVVLYKDGKYYTAEELNQ